MRDQLQQFQRFIQNCYAETQDITLFKSQLEVEKKLLIDKVNSLLFADHKDDVIKRIIRIFQVELTAISNSVYRQTESENEADQIVLQEINKLINYTRDVASTYYDKTIRISDYELDQRGTVLTQNFSDRVRKLKRNNVEVAILDVLRDYFSSINSISGTFSLNEIEYAEKLLRGIDKMIQRESSSLWHLLIWKLLIYLNFNHEPILKLARIRVQKIADQDCTQQQIRDELAICLGNVRVLEVQHSLAYHHDRDSLRDYFLALISEQIAFIDSKEIQPSQDSQYPKSYIVVDLTAKQLGLFISLNVEKERICNLNTTQTLAIATQFIHTRRGGSISYETNRKKIGEVDITTVQGLHIYLKELTELLESKHKEFFD